MGRESRTRLVTVVVLVAVFGAGVLVGFAADATGTAQVAEATPATGETVPVDSTEAEEPRRRPRYELVGPNEEQLALIDEIVKVHRARTNALDEETRAEFNRRFREILLETRAEIKAVFTGEQAAEYQRLLDEWDAGRAERENEDQRN